MKYTLTSAEAAKLLKKVIEEKNLAMESEEQRCMFHAALGEDMESVRPEYDYEETQRLIKQCDEKIRRIKHAINSFNVIQTVGDTGMTIDQVLVYIPQLTERKNRLYNMQNRLPKQRVGMGGIGANAVIDYLYMNYSVEQARADYAEVSEELRNLQTALDLVNTTVKMEIELPD